MLNKLESKEPGPAPCTREGMKVHQRWNYFIVKKKDMAVICKLRTVTTNLLEIDTARTLSARSSTLYQTPMRRMTTTGSEKKRLTGMTCSHRILWTTFRLFARLKVTTATMTPF